MEYILHLFVFLPLLGFFISLLIPERKEMLLSATAFSTVGIHLISFVLFIVFWFWHGHPKLNFSEMVIYESGDYQFLIDFYFDKISAVYLAVGSFLTFLITIYSRYYLHREKGYKRFFNTILFFYAGYTITILSGNFETLFVGWEVLGISSFLLIAFYRERYLPIKNAVKVFSIYRIGDLGILLAMWMSHHLWHENISFMKLNNYELVHEHLQTHSLVGIFISLMILIAAAAKSAQLPFSSWLPRAMEGPTPSSAIFYGSLSVHIGVFLLLRTYPLWEYQTSVRVMFALVGGTTAIIGTLIAHVQSSIKSQIAYASIAQIGVIFIELAAGLETLALFHFAGNAFLRTYQLLVSPSMVSYLIREQFYHYTPRVEALEDTWPRKIKYTFYMLSLKEWNLDWLMFNYIWMPLKNAGRKAIILPNYLVLGSYILVLGVGIWIRQTGALQSFFIAPFFPFIFAFLGLMLVLKAFVERKDVLSAWIFMIMNHCYVALAISFNEKFEARQIMLYISGIILAGITGYLCIQYLINKEKKVNLNQFNGYNDAYPKVSFMFLLSCLGLWGFPITSTFIGEDLIYTHIAQNQLFLAALISIGFILDGLALIRMYSRLFMGTSAKGYHEIPYRSS
jgi:NADH:ubiquinone oxidoreductase subunit 5 (subunit L)/multisubunit Na+/H+ antiporter MnhA subunit